MGAARPTQAAASEALTPTADVFASLAEELERARAMGLRIEGAICAMAVRSAIDGTVVAELQQLDAVLQHLGALRDFAAELARNADAAHAVATQSALDRITLGEVRMRLGRGYVQENPDEIWEML
jgi:5,10-methenyltetrahydromethanopterin hydrogenase